ncbi:MAG: sigma-70 family RNA polymerase sigma factor [Planctomycetota bacterium]|nr:MAG: sigma-70 family RNA polymerase sigma factor [Planctomycetota bacterium]
MDPRTSKKYATGVNAAARVFAEYSEFIRGVIRYRVRNEAQAEDLFQDFFLTLIVKPLPEGIQNKKGYLYRRIVNNIVNATHRVENYQARIHRYAERAKYSTTEYNPESELIAAEQMDKMFELIEKRLPEREAEAVGLRYKKDLPVKEVATQMRVNNRTVSRYISIGLCKIRQVLAVSQGD